MHLLETKTSLLTSFSMHTRRNTSQEGFRSPQICHPSCWCSCKHRTMLQKRRHTRGHRAGCSPSSYWDPKPQILTRHMLHIYQYYISHGHLQRKKKATKKSPTCLQIAANVKLSNKKPSWKSLFQAMRRHRQEPLSAQLCRGCGACAQQATGSSSLTSRDTSLITS